MRYVRHPESYEQTVSLAQRRRRRARAAAEAPAPPERDDDRDRDHPLGSWWGVRGVEPAHVFAEWLTDSAAFNEWCEEEDYLWEDRRRRQRAPRARRRGPAKLRRCAAASFGTLPGWDLWRIRRIRRTMTTRTLNRKR